MSAPIRPLPRMRPPRSVSSGLSRQRLGREVVVGIERTIAGLRAELDRARSEERALRGENARLERALARSEAAGLEQALDLDRAKQALRTRRERERSRRAIEEDRERLADRCQDLELAVERERRAGRALREEMDTLIGELERVCTIIAVLVGEDDGAQSEAAGAE